VQRTNPPSLRTKLLNGIMLVYKCCTGIHSSPAQVLKRITYLFATPGC
jgi:hypothetical protein